MGRCEDCGVTPFAGDGDCACGLFLSTLMARCRVVSEDELDRKFRAAMDEAVVCLFAVAERDEADPRDILEQAFDDALARGIEAGDIVRRWSA